MIPDILGHYEIMQTLGQGQHGTVYLARDARLDRRVAIKVLRGSGGGDAHIGRVLLEARTAALLDHPYICRVYDVGEEAGFAYIAMEYVGTRSLLEALDSGPLDTLTALRYGVQVCEALTYAHERGVLHGDIKASNVLLSSDAEAKLVDFGQATSSETSLDPGGDLWRFGALLHAMVTGVLPAAPTMTLGQAAPLPHSVPTGLAAIIERCLESDHGRRYRCAREILRDLRMEADGERADQRPAKKARSRRARLVIACSAATMLALLALALIHTQTFRGWTGTSTQGGAVAVASPLKAPGGAMVWVNKRNRKYHCPDSPWYGKTLDGDYVSEEAAVAGGFRPAYGKPCR